MNFIKDFIDVVTVVVNAQLVLMKTKQECWETKFE